MIGKSVMADGQIQKRTCQLRGQKHEVFSGHPFAGHADGSASAQGKQVLDFDPTSSM
jgi:hypothetical protein